MALNPKYFLFKEKDMSSRQSVLISGARSGISTVHADCFARGSSHAVHIARDLTRTRTAAQRRFRLNENGQAHFEQDIRLEERCRERARIVQELHDTLFQGFVGASMLLDHAVEQTPADSPFKPELSRALRLIHRALDEGRAAMGGYTPLAAPLSLDQAFSKLLEDVTPSPAVQLQVFVQGEPFTLNPAIHEQVFLIGREAVMNALRHSEATKIEVEVHYLCDLIIVCVHDNGCGINSDAAQKDRDSHWGLRGMRDRAESIDAQLDIWSRQDVGTEVRVSVAKPTSQDCAAC